LVIEMRSEEVFIPGLARVELRHPFDVVVPMKSGLRVRVNSHGRSYFDGYTDHNCAAAQPLLWFSPSAMASLGKNRFRSSFLSEEDKHCHRASVDASAAERAIGMLCPGLDPSS
jgi:adenosine deaminase